MAGRRKKRLGSSGKPRKNVAPKTLLDFVEQARQEADAEPHTKYRAKPTEVDGIKFASKKEARRYSALKMMRMAGQIHGLKLQVKFPLVVNGMLITTYVCDFAYREEPGNVYVVEDVKGFLTREYRMKARLMKALYGITIRET